MPDGIEKFIRPDLAGFIGYSAAASPETLEDKTGVPVERIIKLDANENPYGCSPRVQAALGRFQRYHVYPDNAQVRLRQVLADYAGVSPAQVVAESGSNRLIDLALRLFTSPGDEVINCVPTFGVYRFSSRLAGVTVVDVPRRADFSVDVAGVRAAVTGRTRLIFVASPNNPTGTPLPREDVLALLETGIPLLVDEAYYEFSGETTVPLVAGHSNLMVLRTLSKWAGLAGLRLGYGVFPELVARYLLTIKMPYNVNAAALVAVEESLKDIDYLKGRVQAIIAERERLSAGLSGLGWLEPIPSAANFILCRVLRGTARDLHARLRQRGILVRYFEEPRVEDCIRISVGRPEDTDALLAALRQIGG